MQRLAGPQGLQLPSRVKPSISAGRRLALTPRCFIKPAGQNKPRVSPSIFYTPNERQGSVVTQSTSHENFNIFDIDSYSESIRKDLRTVYDHDRWVKHRSPSRYLRHMLGLFGSRMLRGMTWPLLYVIGVATAVCAYQTALAAGQLPAIFPNLQINSSQLGQLFGLTSFALSLLLVFRTNASYERWDSARKMWGQVLNRCRDLARQGLGYISRDKAQLREMLCRWIPAFPKALMCHLRTGEDLRAELESTLLPHEATWVINSKHRPVYVLQVLTAIIRAAQLPTAIVTNMEMNLATFGDSLGGCERILRTPIPLSYSTHTSRFMIMWLTLLPFTLYGPLGWGAVPTCGVIAFLMLGIKEITVTIEEPFSILALEVICNTILTNVKDMLATESSAYTNDDSAAMPASGVVAELVLETPNGKAVSIAAA